MRPYKIILSCLLLFILANSYTGAQDFGKKEPESELRKSQINLTDNIIKTIPGGVEIWNSLSLYGGEMTSVVRHPVDPLTAYIGTRDAGVFKTIDGGLSWIPSRNGLTCNPIRTIVIDKNNPQVIYAGTDFDGIWKSVDAGNTWFQTAYPGEFVVFNIIIDPENSQILYVGEAGGVALGVGHVFKSSDGGINWIKIENGLPEFSDGEYTNGILSLAIDPSDNQTLYVGTIYSGLFKTTNGGGSWQSFDTGIPARSEGSEFISPVNSLAVCVQHPERPLAIISGIPYKFIDDSWQKISDWYAGEAIFHGPLYYHPTDSLMIFTSSCYSVDGGYSWEEFEFSGNNGSAGFDDISEVLQGSNIMYGALSWDGGAAVSSDLCKTWTESSAGITAATVYSVAVRKDDPDFIYAGTTEHFMYSEDGGDKWESSYYIRDYGGGFTDTVRSIGEVRDIEVDPVNPDVIYLAGMDCYRSDDGGKTLTELDSAYSQNFIKRVDHPASNTVYAAGNGVRRSYDSGNTWTKLNNGLPTELGSLVEIKGFCLDPVDTSCLWAGTWHSKGIFKTTDGGQNWVSMGLTEIGYISAIAVHPENNNIIFAGGGDFEGHIFKSVDGGLTWEITKDEIAYPRAFVFDPRNPDQIYAATEGYGILRSDDGGETWNFYNEGIFYPLHYSIDISGGSSPLMVTGSYGSGLYYIQPGLCSPVGIITQPTDRTVCMDNTTDFSVVGDGNLVYYQWYKDNVIIDGEEERTLELAGITIDDEGDYYCKVYNGCSSVMSDTALLSVVEVDISVDVEGSTLTAASGADQYQWIDCSTNQSVTGEVNAAFTAINTGDYAVVVTSGSCVDTSDCYSVFGVGIRDKQIPYHWKIFPNPVTEKLNIQITENIPDNNELIVQVISLSGMKIAEKELENTTETQILDFSNIAEGAYIVKFHFGETNYSQLIIKQ